MLITLTVAIIAQCIHTSKRSAVHLKSIRFLFVNYISIKLKKIDFWGTPQMYQIRTPEGEALINYLPRQLPR